jgi:hypothetical protein
MFENFLTFQVTRFGVPAVAIFKLTLGHAAFADDDSVRNADQLGVSEFHARSCVTVIE